MEGMSASRSARPHALGVQGSRMGAVAVLSAVSIWGVTNTLVKLSHLSALSFAVYRLGLGAVVLFGALLVSRRRLTLPQIRAALPAGVLFGVQIVFWFGALKHTSLVDATMISALQPALVLLVAGRMFGEHAARRDVLLTLASLVGVAVVTFGSAGTPAWSLGGDLLAVASLLGWTAYMLLSKRVRDRVPPLQYMAVVFLIAAVLVLPIALVAGAPLGGVRTTDWLILLVFVIGASSGHVLLAWAHSSVDVSLSSTLLLAQPVLTAVAALLILGEPIPVLAVVGGAVVLGSLGAVVRHASIAGPPPELESPDVPG